MNICIKCGAMAIGNNLCRKHFRHQQRLIDLKKIEINRCRSCGSVYSKGRKFDDISKALERFIVAKNARFSSKIHLSGNRATALIEAEGFEHGIPVRERHEKEFVLKKMMCLDCSKLSGGYSEAVIQFRAEDAKDVESFIREGVFIKETKSGPDYYFLRKNEAAKIAKKLKEKYAIKKTSKLMGQKKDRKIYKDFYSVK